MRRVRNTGSTYEQRNQKRSRNLSDNRATYVPCSSSSSVSSSESSSSKIEVSSVMLSKSVSANTACVASNVVAEGSKSPERIEAVLVRAVASVVKDLRPPWPSDKVLFPVMFFTGCLLSLAREDCSDPMLKDCLVESGVEITLDFW